MEINSIPLNLNLQYSSNFFLEIIISKTAFDCHYVTSAHQRVDVECGIDDVKMCSLVFS